MFNTESINLNRNRYHEIALAPDPTGLPRSQRPHVAPIGRNGDRCIAHQILLLQLAKRRLLQGFAWLDPSTRQLPGKHKRTLFSKNSQYRRKSSCGVALWELILFSPLARVAHNGKIGLVGGAVVVLDVALRHQQLQV